MSSYKQYRKNKINNIMKKITIELPDDCEVKIIKKENNIEGKLEKPVIKTYQDLIDNNIKINVGYWINPISDIYKTCNFTINSEEDKNVAASEKVAKSMLAMAMISQLMPYYGGEITDEEWKNENLRKNIIGRQDSNIFLDYNYGVYEFLAFHTEDQRDKFITNNEQLVKDYLMID